MLVMGGGSADGWVERLSPMVIIDEERERHYKKKACGGSIVGANMVVGCKENQQ
jgi:hypothetical protein